MPLPPSPIPRQRLHQRSITYEGFRRDDGLFDIDAHLVDAKDHDFELLTGVRPAREAVHDMWVRVTIDRAFVIHAIEVRTDAMPYPDACDRIEPAYSKLIGANLVQGFRKRLHDDMGGVRGCTHVTELLGSLPTAAVQTFAGLQREDEGDAQAVPARPLPRAGDHDRHRAPLLPQVVSGSEPLPRPDRSSPPPKIDLTPTTQEPA